MNQAGVSRMNKFDLVKAASKYLNFLSDAGLELEVSTDFENVPTNVRQFGRNHQLPTFAIDRVDHTQGSAFWLFLNEGDERIGGAAAILQDIGRENFGDFLTRVARHQYPMSSGDAVREVAAPLRDKVSGRLAYIGELAIRSDRRGDRKRLSAFMRFLQALILLEWDVDWTYAFIPDRHMRARLDLVYGFTQSLPRAQLWHSPEPELRSSHEWWVGSPRSELEYLLKSELRHPEIL